MAISTYIPALLLGFAGSLHCVGMCGPIMMSVPIPSQHKVAGIILYHTGRIMMYGLLGILAGWLGWRVEMAGWQQLFSIITGSLILLLFFGKALAAKVSFNPFRKQLFHFISHVMQMKHWGAMPLMGAANGLLPCGMVYIALTGAAAAGGFWQAIVFMIFFGIGTLPLLFALAYWGLKLSYNTRQSLQKIVPYMVALTAILLIIRGMNLNIPWLSPMISTRSGNTLSCH